MPQRIEDDLCSEKLRENSYGDWDPGGGFSAFWISWKHGKTCQRQF